MRILYVTTSFPVASETFLQREVRAMRDEGVDLRIVSLHRGEESFEGLPIRRFRKIELLALLWRLPWLLLTRWDALRPILASLFAKSPPSWINFWENALGFGAAAALSSEMKRLQPDGIHCVWGGAPASFGWLIGALIHCPFSMGAHAYDVFENGGDWLLAEKATRAKLVHTTTNAAKDILLEHVDASRVQLIYRGLNALPALKPVRQDRSKLRIVCIARLVEKKGFPLQLRIYREMKAAGLEFEARILGEGPLRGEIERTIKDYGLSKDVSLLGWVKQERTQEELAWADALIHTGIIARNGDRDGLPNVIPEAMAMGVLVVASPVSGVVEAVSDGKTGLLLDPSDPVAWLKGFRCIQENDAVINQLQNNARNWVENNFQAIDNTGKLLQCLRSVFALAE